VFDHHGPATPVVEADFNPRAKTLSFMNLTRSPPAVGSCHQDERLAPLLCAPIFYVLACLHELGFIFVSMLPLRPVYFHDFPSEAS
jgi:hypothetical protein